MPAQVTGVAGIHSWEGAHRSLLPGSLELLPFLKAPLLRGSRGPHRTLPAHSFMLQLDSLCLWPLLSS